MPPQAPPFRWVDRLLEGDLPRRCVTLKVFSADEPLLRGMDRVPFSLILEALCQGAAFLSPGGSSGQGRILRMDQAEMTGTVRPGESLRITSTLLEENAAAMKAESVGEVEGRIVARLLVLVAR